MELTKAMILAAGLGSRLGPLTEEIPKALVRVNDQPMLQIVVEKLINKGIREVLVNVHHHGGKIISFLEQHDFGIDVTISDERDQLLDTGGAIAKAAHFFSGQSPILIHNVDIISDTDLDQLWEDHHKNKALATLCVRKRESSRSLLFDRDMRLVGWSDNKKNEFKWAGAKTEHYRSFAFSGVYLVNTDFPERLPFRGNFSIVDAWLKMAGSTNIYGYEDLSACWFDLGTAQKISKAEEYLKGTI